MSCAEREASAHCPRRSPAPWRWPDAPRRRCRSRARARPRSDRSRGRDEGGADQGRRGPLRLCAGSPGRRGDLLTGLSAALNKEAKARNITLVPEEDATATYKVKGYVSAVGGPSGTLLVYVFDMLDSRGVRIHRVSGQETRRPRHQRSLGRHHPPTVAAAARHAIDDLAAG